MKTKFLQTLIVSIVILLPSALPCDMESKAVAEGGKDRNAIPQLRLHLRSRVETKPGSGRFHAITEQLSVPADKTAIIVCDMWDKHWCRGASSRVAEMAPRMNEVLRSARSRGVTIIHAPSGTMKFYEGTSHRRRAQSVAPLATQAPLKEWCHLVPDKE